MAGEANLDDVIAALRAILKTEKAILLEGRYTELSEIAKVKENLCANLNQQMVAQENVKKIAIYRKALAALNAEAKENEQLLEAAKIGMSRAHARVKDIINRQRNVGVYASTGDKVLTPGAGVSRSKMA